MPAAGGGDAPPPAAACAACKYQRRRCKADCPLADYFPHDRPRVFRSAHRLFGVSNILKTLDRAGADPEKRHEAMQCIVYESQAWDLYPSAGCVAIIAGLQERIQQTKHELRRVHAHLHACRRAAAAGPSPEATSNDQVIAAAAGRDNAAAVTSDDGGNMLAPPPQTLPWTIQPPQYEHPFFVNATTAVPQQLYYGQHQPIVASTQLPEWQDDDTMNYFADGINGEDDEMPRESGMHGFFGEKAMIRNAPKMKDNIKQDRY